MMMMNEPKSKSKSHGKKKITENNNSECPFKNESQKDCEENAECDDCSKWAFCSVTFANEE